MIFDSDPAVSGTSSESLQQSEMSQAMIRWVGLVVRHSVTYAMIALVE